MCVFTFRRPSNVCALHSVRMQSEKPGLAKAPGLGLEVCSVVKVHRHAQKVEINLPAQRAVALARRKKLVRESADCCLLMLLV